jgi:hypothetical protein
MKKDLYELIKTLEKKYHNTQNEYSKYVLDRKELCKDNEIKTKQDARRFLDDIDTEGDFENSIRES